MKAVAYYRTSSIQNVDGDSQTRQREAVQKYAENAGYEIVAEFYDGGVSGADPIFERPAFGEMLSYLRNCEDCTAILMENASRLSRDLIVQELGHAQMREEGINLIPVDAPEHFQKSDSTSDLIRQILGSVSQFEKAQVVSKLKGARQRKKEATGKGEGRLSVIQIHGEGLYTLAKKLYRKPRKGQRLSYRAVGVQLSESGYTTKKGTPFMPAQVRQLLLEGPRMVREAKAVQEY
ncbi:MAG: recombinase family protein [Pseudodesulfovibrio sp.]